MSRFLFVLGVYAAGMSVVGNFVNQNVPLPYMDEIFHVPQVQKYCVGNYTDWDPKITTLPGLYLISVGIVSPLNCVTSLFTGDKLDLASCSTQNLRSQNVVFGLLNFILLYCLTGQLHGEKDKYTDSLALLSSVNISLLPVLFFFNFMYYTDTVSTSMVLLMYSLYLSEKLGLASVAGFLSVLCRQTNIVWVFCVAGLAVGQHVLEQIHIQQTKTKQPPTISLTTSGQIMELISGTLRLAKQPPLLAKIIGLIVVRCIGFIMVGVAFILFVKINKGIVVGDRSAHVAVLHLPQILYFILFCCALCLPFIIKYVKPFINFAWRNKIFILLSGIVLMCIIEYNTLAHPYLLADNRHFTFYIWRRFFMRHWSLKFTLIPAYIFGGYCVSNLICKSELMFRILFPFCVVLSLAPQALLEFRYYIIPFIFVRLQVKPTDCVKLAVEFCILVAINSIVFYLFLFKPFKWEHQPDEVQRFMW